MADTKDKSFTGAITQVEANYVELSTTKGKACANCRWYLAYGNNCFIVNNFPLPILATGYCDRWEANPPPEADPVDALAEALTEAVTDSGAMISGALLTSYNELKPTHKTTFKERLAVMLGRKNNKPAFKAFRVFKDADGVDRWHAIHTNNFIDREKEIITEAAHDAYIDRVDSGLVPMPLLMVWHTPGTEIGQADAVWRVDNFIHSTGTFFDTDMAKSAKAYYRKHADDLKMSHGFEHPEWAFDGKCYHAYNTFEVTTLPAFAAANPYTTFEEIMNMEVKNMTPEKEKHLKAVFGENGFKTILEQSQQASKDLQAIGTEYKDYANPDGQSAPVSTQSDEDKFKAVSQMITDLHALVTETVGTVTTLSKALTAKDSEIQALKATVKGLDDKHEAETAEWQKALDTIQKQLNVPPERASESASTVVKGEDGKPLTQAKDDLPTDIKAGLSFFGAKTRTVTP